MPDTTFYTITMAKVQEEQGNIDNAIEIYEHLLEQVGGRLNQTDTNKVATHIGQHHLTAENKHAQSLECRCGQSRRKTQIVVLTTAHKEPQQEQHASLVAAVGGELTQFGRNQARIVADLIVDELKCISATGPD